MLKEFNRLKKALLKIEFSKLNRPQQEAVFNSDGAILILAGAGSGKTTTIVNKIAYMLKYGDSYEDFKTLPSYIDENAIAYMEAFAGEGMQPDDMAAAFIKNNPVPAYNILAFTFTNKAANEMKERIAKTAGNLADDMWIGTFHSICVRILRRFIDKIPGYTKDFVIYDTDDQKTLMKECFSLCNINEKELSVGTVLNEISSAKDKLYSPEDYIREKNSSIEFDVDAVAKLYRCYQQKLMEYNALDFDDIICNTVKLLMRDETVLYRLSNRFKYILVDEYQDTNMVQYKLISLLASVHKNICVVGDDDQSIYGWRGADITNILEFENQYENCKVIKLEQNYRSTDVILQAANEVIKNNRGRKGKKLWTEISGGENIDLYAAMDDRDEAANIALIIKKYLKDEKYDYDDFTVLYRNHSLSRVVEEMLIREGIPYKIIGGLRFYERKEIKDILAYIRMIVNSRDNISLKRIINVPKRGIGKTSVDKLAAMSENSGKSMFDIIKTGDLSELGRSGKNMFEFSGIIDDISAYAALHLPSESIKYIINTVNIAGEYEKEDEITRKTRMENIEELISVAAELEEKEGITTISEFLEYTSLITDLSAEEEEKAVSLMTMHAAKGLEFPVVFIAGLEKGIFPKNDDWEQSDEQMEEDRRLFYVAITRAKEKLNLSYSKMRMIYGKTMYQQPSRFIDELPREIINMPMRLARPVMKAPPKVTPKIPNAGFAQAKAEYKVSNGTGFNTGTKVMHKKFGAGIIKDISSSGSLVVLTVEFEQFGTKNIVSTAVTAME